MSSEIILTKQTAVSIANPAAGKVTVFVDTADGLYKQKDESGTVRPFYENAATASNISAAIAAHEAAGDPHTQYETSAEAQAKVDAHATLTNNPHLVTKSQVGLGNVDNTSDANKPVSTATQTALNLKYDASNPSGYQTAAQVTSTVNTASTADRDRANHTGTQLKATISDFAHTHPLSAIEQSGATASQVPTWDGTAWVPQTPAGAETILRVTATQSVASVTPTSITELTSASLAAGWYSFECYMLCQSTATANGIGLRISPVTATIGVVHAKWEIDQAADGTDRQFQYSQVLTTTNLFSASVLTANADFVAQGSGVFNVTTAGTVAIQLRGETATSVSARVGSLLIIKKVG